MAELRVIDQPVFKTGVSAELPSFMYHTNPNSVWRWDPYILKFALWDRFLNPEYTIMYTLAGVGAFTIGQYVWSGVKNWFNPQSLLSMVPGTAALLKNEVQSQVDGMIKPVTDYKLNEIPLKGRDAQAVWDEMMSFTNEDVKKDGTAFAYVYDTPYEHIKQQIDKIFLHFSNTNALSPLAFPSLRVMENAIVSAVAHLLNDDAAVGSLTSGGSESLFCAIKAYRDQAEALYGITEPEMIAPKSCHPAINKACHVLKIKLHMIPIDENTGEVNIEMFENAIHRGKTILLLGSAPSYPHGIVDPIADICALGEAYNLPVHVDACIGGFILPFIEQIWKERLLEKQLEKEFAEPVNPSYLPSANENFGYGLDYCIALQAKATETKVNELLKENFPLWDFRLKNVQSISLDLHKYGYTPKGSSLIMYRTPELRKYCFYATSEWVGGLFVSPSMLGTRGGGNIASSYAALQLYGIEGYKSLTRDVLTAKEGFLKAVLSQPELEVIGTPLSSIISFRVKRTYCYTANILAIGDVLEMPELKFNDGTTYIMQRKWKIEKQHSPDSIHMTLMAMHKQQIEAFTSDLPQAIRYAKENHSALSSSSTAGMYGMVVNVNSIAPSVLTEFLKEFESTVYSYKDPINAKRRPDVLQQEQDEMHRMEQFEEDVYIKRKARFQAAMGDMTLMKQLEKEQLEKQQKLKQQHKEQQQQNNKSDNNNSNITADTTTTTTTTSSSDSESLLTSSTQQQQHQEVASDINTDDDNDVGFAAKNNNKKTLTSASESDYY